jgi:polysaccharide deacetylase family protein (PEP-CTERM system associated)
LGWIAEKYPGIIKEIDRRGYEIGSHSYDHNRVSGKSKNEFCCDLERSVKTIEDCIGKKVRMFRAPAFSITKDCVWAFEILHEFGIEFDCSIFPAHRDYGGFPHFSSDKPAIVDVGGVRIKEFPINLGNLFGKRFVFSGGGYFRFFPYRMIKKLANKSDYIMSYFHPRDFDYKQPVLKGLPLTRRFKSYVGLKSCEHKLKKFLNDNKFLDINQANGIIDWDKAEVISL